MRIFFAMVCSILLLSGCSTTRVDEGGSDTPRALATASERLVMVGVFDDVTRAPVVGAKVTASYFFDRPSLRIVKGDEALTDDRGVAVVKGKYGPGLGLGASFTADISTNEYKCEIVTSGSYNDRQRILARSATEKPSDCDIEFFIASEATKEKRRREWEEKRAAASHEAQRLFSQEPNYWPPSGDDPYPWAKGDSANELIGKRWEIASKSSLGTQTDDAAIRKAVIQHMKVREASVNEIRWLDSTTVMVNAGWYAGPLAAAGYTYVLKKSNGGDWQVIAYYMNFIS